MLSGDFSNLLIKSQSKISTLIAVAFICLSAWLGGKLFWSVYEDSSAVTRWKATPYSGESSTSGTETDVAKLIDATLFGTYSEKAEPVPVAPVVQDAPKTRLNLILVGAVSSSVPENSLAVISNRGTQSTYGIGEQIEGTQARLKGVFIDRVIIENAGRDETLMLEGIEYKRAPQPSRASSGNVSSRGVGNNPVAAVESLDEIRTEILEDPQKILQYIRLSQVKKDGNLVGYRVRPGKQRALFDSVGLKNGDIATSLNGEDLTDPASMGKIWQSMSELTEFSLTVEREGQTHEIYIAF